MWMLYAFSLGFGLVAGFAVPAGNSIVPMLVKEKDLQAGNSLIMDVGQLAGFVGPVVAGILIGQFSESLFGIGLAFGIDAVTFAVSAITLWLMRGVRPPKFERSREDSVIHQIDRSNKSFPFLPGLNSGLDLIFWLTSVQFDPFRL